ncbi:unnamed protein product [Durusdinium trenchii]|uniref:Uncharacterized protein n=1 Tax=Durusdinium trenchii TaxID=1381693 RepID=A0ABP0HYC7_9DINO
MSTTSPSNHVILAALASAEHCVEEASLLQGVSQAKLQEKVQELHEQIPDLNKILEKAKSAVNAGIGQITTQMTSALDELNETINANAAKLNNSVQKFEASMAANFTVEHNVTHFKKLVQENTGNLLPFYNQALKTMNTSLSTTKTVLSAMGQKDLVEKLESLESTASKQLNELVETTKDMGTDMAGASVEKFVDYRVTMLAKLGSADQCVDLLRKSFNQQMAAFAGSLLEPLKIALGDKAVDEINDLSTKTDEVLQNLQTLVTTTSSALTRIGDGVDSKIKAARDQEGFWGHLFHGLLR